MQNLVCEWVDFPKFLQIWAKISPSIGLTNLAKPYHVHYHLSQPDMAGQPRLGRGATRRAPASVQRFALLADVRGNKACSSQNWLKFKQILEKSGDFAQNFTKN